VLPVGSAIALIVGNGPISVFALGVFIKPLEAEFGWSRASISAGLSLCGLFSALALPLVGGLMDRYGVRRPLLIALSLFALNIASDRRSDQPCNVHCANGSKWHDRGSTKSFGLRQEHLRPV